MWNTWMNNILCIIISLQLCLCHSVFIINFKLTLLSSFFIILFILLACTWFPRVWQHTAIIINDNFTRPPSSTVQHYLFFFLGEKILLISNPHALKHLLELFFWYFTSLLVLCVSVSVCLYISVRERDESSYAICLSHDSRVKHYRIDILPTGNFAIQDGPKFESIIAVSGDRDMVETKILRNINWSILTNFKLMSFIFLWFESK